MASGVSVACIIMASGVAVAGAIMASGVFVPCAIITSGVAAPVPQAAIINEKRMVRFSKIVRGFIRFSLRFDTGHLSNLSLQNDCQIIKNL
jgi:hypothetical protein